MIKTWLRIFALLLIQVSMVWANTQTDYFSRHGSGDSNLNPSEQTGRDIWYKATAGNWKFHMYVLPQRVGGFAMDWSKFLGAAGRNTRFNDYGLINDPDCCVPGKDCQARFGKTDPVAAKITLADTYGMDYCPGMNEVLEYVGEKNKKYRDPACSLEDPGGRGDKADPCGLQFGISAGAVGFRLFPNPDFDKKRWLELTKNQPQDWSEIRKRLDDASIERPFNIGISCASCHASHNPVNPPKDMNHPQWENIKGLVGNQFMRASEIFGSGFPPHSLEWETLSRTRPGIVDTSAVPNDQINNPGTMNAIINFARRPTYIAQANTWYRVPAGQSVPGDNYYCDKDHPNKCWRKDLHAIKAMGILKDTTDSVGPLDAIKRVYINIGMCSEECWLNHLTDFRVFNRDARNYGQTPFNNGMCRVTCSNYSAVEDRLPEILDFLLTARPSDLYLAQNYKNVEEMIDDLGRDKWERGQEVFASQCARCHSSQKPPGNDFKGINFLSTKDPNKSEDDQADVPQEKKLRFDWMGNDKLTAVSTVGTFACRALHTNHNIGHVWEEFASKTRRAEGVPTTVQTAAMGATSGNGRVADGRGYYRNISLLSLWAFAPFMHNNAIGPEVCGKKGDTLYRSPYVDRKTLQPLPASEKTACVPFDPSVEGRLEIFKKSMYELLHPNDRLAKMTVTDAEVRFPMVPPVLPSMPGLNTKLSGLTWVIPKGTSVSLVGSFRHKDFVHDFYVYLANKDAAREEFRQKYAKEYGDGIVDELTGFFQQTIAAYKASDRELRSDPKRLNWYLSYYSHCNAIIENDGHVFGSDLEEPDKDALTAFLMTL